MNCEYFSPVYTIAFPGSTPGLEGQRTNLVVCFFIVTEIWSRVLVSFLLPLAHLWESLENFITITISDEMR